MATLSLGIVDTRSANFNSVIQAFNRLSAHIPLKVTVSSSCQELSSCDKLILPGVGTASAVMAGILGCSHDEVLKRCSGQEQAHSELMDMLLAFTRPVLGICLGMQVQAESSTEVPLNSGLDHLNTLGIVSGQVHRLQSGSLPLPHMGWNTIRHNGHPLFEGIPADDSAYFYFVHSFCLDVGSDTIATSCYGQDFSAAVARNNFMGVQFHPEKSGAVGERLLTNFLNL